MKKRKRLRKTPGQKTQPGQSLWSKRVATHELDWLEKMALVLGLWFILYPRPYKELFTIMLIMPLFGLVLNGLRGRPSFASLFRIKEASDDKLDLADFIDLPPWILLLRILLDFEFDAWTSMIIPGVIAAGLVVGFLFITHKGIAPQVTYRKDMYMLAIANIVVFAMAGAYGANCVYDKKTPEQHWTTVIEKTISRGRRSTTYRVKVQPWGHHYDTESIRIDAGQFNNLEKGDSVMIDMHSGLLGIPWYHIAKPKAVNELD